jgi:hypothetical protein
MSRKTLNRHSLRNNRGPAMDRGCCVDQTHPSCQVKPDQGRNPSPQASHLVLVDLGSVLIHRRLSSIEQARSIRRRQRLRFLRPRH